MKRALYIFLLTVPLFAKGQIDPDCYVEKYFLIIQSTRDYKDALSTAQTASKELSIILDLRDLIPDVDTLHGLSMPVDSCLKYSREYGSEDSTCYLARGRWDDGIYISIEYSSAYDSFSTGYFIVMAGSASDKGQALTETLQNVRTKYPDSYIKASKVYMCCMH